MRNLNPLLLLAVFCAAFALTPNAWSQKTGRTVYRDQASGFSFKPLRDFETKELNASEQARGVVLHLWGTIGFPIKTPSGKPAMAHAELFVVRAKHPEAAASAASGLRSRLGGKKAETIGPGALIPSLFHEGLRDFEANALHSKDKKIGKIKARNELFQSYFVETSTTQLDASFDCWVFPLQDNDIIFIWRFPLEAHKKWAKATAKSMKSFKPLVQVVEERVHTKGSKGYEAAWKKAKDECDTKFGWQLIETPAQDWLFLSSDGDAKRVAALQTRLEALHQLFEQDLPPKTSNRTPLIARFMTHEEDFQTRTEAADNSEITAWYDRERQELLIYSPASGTTAEAFIHRAATRMWLAEKMDHIELLPWFSEGHVEYYTALQWDKKALLPTTNSLDDFDFGPLLQDILSKGIAQSIEDHVRLQHELWTEQNDLLDERAAAVQSWALVAFLRAGKSGKIKGKWDKSWSTILPGYLSAMQNGHAQAATKTRNELQAEMDAFQNAGNRVPEELERNYRIIDLPRQIQIGLWSRAYQSTFSHIDLDALETAWLKWAKSVR